MSDLATRPQQLSIPEHERALAPRNMLEAVMAEVRNEKTDPARLREFLQIGRELQADMARAEFNAAFARVKVKLPSIPKRGFIPDNSGKVRSKFARHDDLHRAITPILTEEGIASSFSFREAGPGRITCVLRLTHEGGHAQEFETTGPAAMNIPTASDSQKSRGAQSFMKRNLLIDVFDILAEDQDDDGTGRGVPDKVTEQQIRQMEDILQEIGPDKAAAFRRWLATQGVEKLADLDQGQAHSMALSMLKTKLGAR